MRRILFIDGFHLFLRNLAVVKETDNNGQSVGGFVGFLKSLRLIIEQIQPNQVIVCWEGEGGSAKRRAIFPEYKNKRKPVIPQRQEGMEYSIDEAEKNKIWQFLKLKEYLNLLPVFQLCVDGTEADDLIAFLCQIYKDEQKIILSADKDFLQLIDCNTFLLSPIKKILYDKKKVFETYGVYPQNILLFRALIGDDKSDAIDGIKGLGPKNALKLFPFLAEEEKVNLSNVLDFAGKNQKNSTKYVAVLEQKELVKRNIKLMDLSSPMIENSAIDHIKNQLQAEKNKLKLEQVGFFIQMAKDGISSINARFLQAFTALKSLA